mmetsp:Transcript_94554/g.237228  ORF Transcript_94554/g.237228 Transcript_94554/m.237228 type:complete len:601 (-) Transcript_94554:174-1976(-)
MAVFMPPCSVHHVAVPSLSAAAAAVPVAYSEVGQPLAPQQRLASAQIAAALQCLQQQQRQQQLQLQLQLQQQQQLQLHQLQLLHQQQAALPQCSVPSMQPAPLQAALLQQQEQQQQHPQQQQRPVVELAAGIESLYRDQLRPYGRILRKRLAELAQISGHKDFEIGAKELRAVCTGCPWLRMEEAQGADWSVELVGRPANFIDVYSPDDVYPAALWQDAATYFASLTDSSMVLPGGRYSCAQVLMQRGLPFLAGCSLGQVCHIVQLAISQKKLLGYLNGTVVPYVRSQSMVKERHAEFQQPCSGSSRMKGSIVTWDVLRHCLQELLGEMNRESQPIPLSNMKRLFRSRFHVDLSETALGYAKVSELLQDSRISDLCEVKLQGHGYIMMPAKAKLKRSLISLADTLCMNDAAAVHPLSSNGAQKSCGSLLQRRANFVQPLSMDEILSDESSPRVAGSQACVATSPVLATTPARKFFPATPSPTSTRGRSLPTLLGAMRRKPQESLLEGIKGSDFNDSRKSPQADAAKTLFALAAKDQVPGSCRATRPAGESAWALRPLTPSTLGNFGLSVHNTFIHAAMPPPTPMQAGSQHRARSLPRDTY